MNNFKETFFQVYFSDMNVVGCFLALQVLIKLSFVTLTLRPTSIFAVGASRATTSPGPNDGKPPPGASFLPNVESSALMKLISGSGTLPKMLSETPSCGRDAAVSMTGTGTPMTGGSREISGLGGSGMLKSMLPMLGPVIPEIRFKMESVFVSL